MIHSSIVIDLWVLLPWCMAGALVGWWLVPLARFIPGKVLYIAKAPLDEWLGPGGGLEQSIPQVRRFWVPVVNAC